MIYLIKKAGQVIKTDWVITVPAIIFYLPIFALVIQILNFPQKDLARVHVSLFFLAAGKIFLDLLIAHAGKQLLEQGQAHFGQVLLLSCKDYLHVLFFLILLVFPLKLPFWQKLSGQDYLLPILDLLAQFIAIIIAPAVVFKGKRAWRQIVELLRPKHFFRLAATLSLVIILSIPAIAILMVLPKILLPLLSAVISGILTTFLVVLVCCYLFENRGEIC